VTKKAQAKISNCFNGK